MKSIADRLRAEARAREAQLSPAERLRLALRLGEDYIRRYAEAHHVDLGTARRVLARARRHDRIPSAAIEALEA